MNNIITQEEKDRIDAICKSCYIDNYTVNNDGTVDAQGDVYFTHTSIREIPVQFREVTGDFMIISNKYLTSLLGCPIKVGGSFSCENNNLNSLEHCPTSVGQHFFCTSNKLTSLEHCPTSIVGNFDCNVNPLETLFGAPKQVGGRFNCSYTGLTSLKGCPTKIGEVFECHNTYLSTLEHFPTSVGGYINMIPNPLVKNLYDFLKSLKGDETKIFLLYQNYYDVWTPEFSRENAQLLIGDIKDGLR